jgi:hypothetical protein
MAARGARAAAGDAVIGFLSMRSPGESASIEAAFQKGLSEAGYVDGQNVLAAFFRNARYCDDCGSGIDSRSGKSASAQPSVPSGYQTTLAYPMARIRFAAFHDIQQSRRQ